MHWILLVALSLCAGGCCAAKGRESVSSSCNRVSCTNREVCVVLEGARARCVRLRSCSDLQCPRGKQCAMLDATAVCVKYTDTSRGLKALRPRLCRQLKCEDGEKCTPKLSATNEIVPTCAKTPQSRKTGKKKSRSRSRSTTAPSLCIEPGSASGSGEDPDVTFRRTSVPQISHSYGTR